MEVSWKAIEAYSKLYAKSIYRAIPPYLYVLLLLITAVGIVLIFTNRGVKHKWQAFDRFVLFEYVALLLCMTVFFRESLDYRAFNLTPFWSYTAESADLQHSLYVEGLMNVLMFIPFGLLLRGAYKGIGWKMMMVVTVGLSVSVELLQFIFKRGYAEFDDVMHNALGAVIGFGLYALVETVVKFMHDRRKAV